MGRDAKLDPASWLDDRLTITNLGHSTLLMNFFGVRIVSDPVLFDRVGLALDSVFTIGPRRATPPPIAPSAFPSVDVILVTHAHADHLDVRSLKALPRSAVVVASQNCARLITPLGFSDVRELGWGASTEAAGLLIRAMGARHWGKRWPPFGADYGFNSYLLERAGHRMLLACDSAYTDLFGTVAADPPEAAAFSIGAYNPWLWNHADPEQVWQMFLRTGARFLVPIHWGTFRLSKEPMDEPMRRLIATAGEDAYRIVLREIGGVWSLSARAQGSEDNRRSSQGLTEDRI